MQGRYKPADLDVQRLRRQQLVAERVFRWTHAVAGDDEVGSVRRWWSLPELYESLGAHGVGWSWRRPTLEQFYQEFSAARKAGIFDVAGKPRIALLDPTVSTGPTEPWPRLRLTVDCVQRLLDTRGDRASHDRLAAAWIEIDRAYQWLLTFVDPEMVRSWSQSPRIAQSLRAAAQHNKRLAAARARGVGELQAVFRTTAPRSAVAEASSSPGAPGLRAAVEATIDALGWPGRGVPWKRFSDEVRARCNVGSGFRGYGDKTIQRIKKEIKVKRENRQTGHLRTS